MAREEHVVEEFWLFMIEKPVEIGVYTKSVDPELGIGALDGDFISSHSGVLVSYYVTEDEWRFRFRNDPNLYVVERNRYNVLISYYTF